MGDITTLKNNSPITVVQALADRPVLATTNALKAKFDEAPDDLREVINSLIDYLAKNNASDDGASNIGIYSPYATNVKDLFQYILSLGGGSLPPDDSITNDKMNSTVKLGLLSALNTTNKDSFVNAINEIVLNLLTANTAILSVSGSLTTHTADTTKHITALTTQGDMLYHDGNNPTRLPKGTARQVLGMDSTGTVQAWLSSLQSLMTSTGDIVYASGANTPARLGIGSTGQILGINGGVPAWEGKLNFANGTGTDSSTSVPNGSYTKTISLGVSAKRVEFVLWDTSDQRLFLKGVVNTSGYGVMFGANKSSTEYATYANNNSIGGVNHDYPWFVNSGSHSLSNIAINGTNLEVTINNSSGSNQTMTLGWRWEAVY